MICDELTMWMATKNTNRVRLMDLKYFTLDSSRGAISVKAMSSIKTATNVVSVCVYEKLEPFKQRVSMIS